MSILIESCNDYLIENINNTIPLYEANDNSNKSIWQKIKDFFKRIWDWIKNKVMALFGKVKKSSEDKLKILKDLLKNNKRKTDDSFKSFIAGIRDGLDSADSILSYYDGLKKDDDATRAKIQEAIDEFTESYEKEVDDAIDFTINNESNIEDYEWALKEIDDEIKRVEKAVKKLTDEIGKSIPDANATLVVKLGDVSIKHLTYMIKYMNTTLLDNSIKAAQEEAERFNLKR